jgi:AcrR family transcriptional regulator
VPAPELIERRRREIAEAARETFAARGYQATGIADIAARLGIGHGTFYRYFENKRDILVYLVGLTVGRIQEALGAEDPTAPGTLEEYRAQAERIGSALFDVFVEEPDSARLYFVEALAADRELTDQMLAAQDLFAQLGARYLSNGVEKGYLRADLDVPTTARAINGMIFAGALLVPSTREPAAERDRWIASITGLMFQGMAA